jgi:hypothetical protein
MRQKLSRQACPEQGRRDAKAQRKGSFYFSELGVLCVFARVIFFRRGNSKKGEFQMRFARI